VSKVFVVAGFVVTESVAAALAATTPRDGDVMDRCSSAVRWLPEEVMGGEVIRVLDRTTWSTGGARGGRWGAA
jgi:hypothetical protein